MSYSNDVTLQGIIVSKYVTPKIAALTLSTGNANKMPNYPRVIFFGKNREKIAEGYEKGDYVKITGNIQSVERNEKNAGKSLISLIGTDIEPAKTVLGTQFGLNEKRALKEFVNTFSLAGTITKIKQLTDNLINVTVFTFVNGRKSFVTLAYYTNSAEKFIEKYHVKDRVYVIGNIQTVKKPAGHETHYFQNYVAIEFAHQPEE